MQVAVILQLPLKVSLECILLVLNLLVVGRPVLLKPPPIVVLLLVLLLINFIRYHFTPEHLNVLVDVSRLLNQLRVHVINFVFF